MGARLRRDLPLAVQRALAEADRLIAADPSGNIHSIGYGGRMIDGKERLGNGIIVTVKRKAKGAELVALGSPRVPLQFDSVFTDVQEQPEAEIQLLRLDSAVRTFIEDTHRQCYNTPIPGGVEIFPIGQAWLGSLGCKVVFRNSSGVLRHGAITNNHVATGKVGTQLGQPGGNSEWFARVAQSPGIDFNGINHVDLSVLDTERIDGKYGPITHTVKAEQVTLGAYKSELSKGGIGTTVARDGRTLGRITDGRISEIGATVRVGYDDGKTALFADQFAIICECGSGFSAPGDSGSMVFEWPAMLPSCLLFAGGGGRTIAGPAEYVLSEGKVHSFQ